MLASMLVRCEQCGHESAPRYHYCGMCGAKLPEPQPPAPPKPLAPLAAEPPKPEPARSEPARQVSGPSFLGLADEPTSSVSYLLEDELSESHWGRSLVLLLILIGIGVASWHWRNELRGYVAARLAQRPNSNQSEQVNPPEPPVAPTGSEVGAGMPSAGTTPAEKPMTGVGDLPATPPPAQNPATPAAVQNAAPSSPPASGANSANEQPSTPVPAAASPTPNQSGTTPTAETQPAQQKETAETASAKEQAPVPASAVTKHLKSKVKQPAQVNSDADQLEAEGEKYLYGTGASASCSRAQTDLKAAAERGSTKADSVLGTMYATGHCFSRDLPLAYRWFAKALQQDPSNARLERDLQVLWNQMSAEERQVAMRR